MWSGNYHLCTDAACPYAEELDDARVCPVTCLQLGPVYRATYEMGARNADQQRATEALRPARAVLPPAAGTRVAGQIRSAPESDRMEVRTLLGRVLASLPERARGEIADIVLQSYSRVKTTRSFLSHSSGAYTLAVHTGVVLYAMKQSGLSRAGRVFVPARADVRRALGPLNGTAALFGASFRRRYKDATRLVFACMVDWLEAHLEHGNSSV